MEASKNSGGNFLWHELLTSDSNAAIDFYKHVVGWNTQEYNFEGNEGPPYTMWLAGDVPLGGVMEIDPQTMGEMPPMWNAYVYTPDIDKTIQRAKELGGSVAVEPMEVPTVGRMAGLADPQGAVLWVLQPGSSEEMPRPPREGSFTWNELATSDYEAASDYYTKLFGWKAFDDMDMGGGMIYRVFGQGESMYGGIYNKSPEMPPHWLFYANVRDIDAALDRVKERGGQVLNGPMEVPGGDKVAQCLDPQGVAFALHQSNS